MEQADQLDGARGHVSVACSTRVGDGSESPTT
jgi:hypothetical protein